MICASFLLCGYVQTSCVYIATSYWGCGSIKNMLQGKDSYKEEKNEMWLYIRSQIAFNTQTDLQHTQKHAHTHRYKLLQDVTINHNAPPLLQGVSLGFIPF